MKKKTKFISKNILHWFEFTCANYYILIVFFFSKTFIRDQQSIQRHALEVCMLKVSIE